MNKRIKDKVKKYYFQNYKGVAPDINQFVADMLSSRQADDEVEWIKKYVNLNKTINILDYGCGIGNVVVSLASKGYKIDGFEVSKPLLQIVQDRITSQKLSSKIFNPKSNVLKKYDLITSIYVAEHVSDLREYLSKGISLLKPGGVFLVFTCNYSIFWEFHYQLFLPIFSKSFSKLILKILGRNIHFFDELLFVTPKVFDDTLKLISRGGEKFRSDNVGKSAFIESISQSKYHSPLFSMFFRVAKFFKLDTFLIQIGFYNPLIYIISKED